MRGLRTKEEKKFIDYFSEVQLEAERLGCVFFLDTQESGERVINGVEVMDLSGWLIPIDKASEFEKIWSEQKEDDDWVDYYVFAYADDKRNISFG